MAEILHDTLAGRKGGDVAEDTVRGIYITQGLYP